MVGNCTKAFPDTDLDGVNDVVDIDDDNDGILDAVEEVCIPTSTFASFANADFSLGATGFTSDIDDPALNATYATYNGVNGFTATWNPYPPTGSRVDPTNNYISTNDLAEQLGRPGLIIGQTITGLQVGNNYELQFDFTSSGTNLEFVINGVSQGVQVFNSTTGVTNFLWAKKRFTFTATATTSTFAVYQHLTGSAGAGDCAL